MKRGLDPNVWFGNVERGLGADRPRNGQYYIAYRLWADQQERRAAAKAEVAKRK